MSLYWLQLTADELPAGTDWLSPGEAATLTGIRLPKRRADWLLGRWTAKCATALYLKRPLQHGSLAQIEIRASASGAPEVFCPDQVEPIQISISHRERVGLCVVAPFGTAIGCDVELIEPHTDAFVADYFTPEERTMIACSSSCEKQLLISLLWSAKESALKALRAGLRFDTRSVAVNLQDKSFDESGQSLADERPAEKSPIDSRSGWRALQVRHFEGQTFQGWWQEQERIVRTVVAVPPPAMPVHLNFPSLPLQSRAR